MEFFDFDQASSDLRQNDLAGESQSRCPSASQLSSELFMDDLLASLEPGSLGIQDAGQAGLTPSTEAAAGFDDFSSWIPGVSRPSAPCDYCRSRRLQCLVVSEAQTACSSCVALVRQCSFSADPASAGFASANDVGELEVSRGLSADAAHAGVVGGTCMLQTLPAAEDALGNDQARKTRNRFSREAVKTLKDWLAAHASHPYPTDAEKDQLKKMTGLKRSQISNWLANARRRGKVPSTRAPSPGARPSPAEPIDIVPRPAMAAANPAPALSVRDMDPLERWKHSPPEHEPASVSAIAKAVATVTLPSVKDASSSCSSWVDRQLDSSANSSFSMFRAPSLVSSVETKRSSGSEFSFGSAFSHQSQHSFSSMEALKRKDRRRRRRSGISRAGNAGEARPFQCTFCTDTFKTKYDWQRHEKSLHLSLEKWICAPFGGANPGHRHSVCAYCDVADPTPDHLETHHHEQCQARDVSERTFYRKDHLRQHLRLVHGCDLNAGMEAWKSAVVELKSRCGFCNQECVTWQGRVDHLAAHFRAGAQMADWSGDWGLEPGIAALVENAMSPSQMDRERRTRHSFGVASKRPGGAIRGPSSQGTDESQGHGYGSLQGNVPYAQLEGILGAWAREKRASGVLVTDQMLRAEARKIVYMSTDPWNQTAADNPQWLDLFRRRNGLSPVREATEQEEEDGEYDLRSLEMEIDRGFARFCIDGVV